MWFVVSGFCCVLFLCNARRVKYDSEYIEGTSEDWRRLGSCRNYAQCSSGIRAALKQSLLSRRFRKSGPLDCFARLLLTSCDVAYCPHRRGLALATQRGVHTRVATRSIVMQLPSSRKSNASDEATLKQRVWRKEMQAQVASFALPALSTALADPLMSLVDGLCCGQFCSTLQLASLGPAIAVFGNMNGIFFFLNAATTVRVTNLLASKGREAATEALSDAVFVAASCGLLTSLTLWIFAPQLIAVTGCVPELIPAAATYLRIRGIGHSLVLSSMVFQAGLLAQRDSTTPAHSIFFACVVNILGDLVLVPRFGAVGAAFATFMSELLKFPLLLFLSAKRRRLRVKMRYPSLKALLPLLSVSGPLFLFELGMAGNYLLIQSLGTQVSVASTAAFQALWNPVNFLAFFCFPFKQVAPVFLPSLVKNATQTVGGAPKSLEFLRVLTRIAFFSGLGLAAVGVGFSMTPGVFTQDSALWSEIQTFAPFVALALAIVPHAQVLEGVLLAIGDLAYLSRTMILNTIIVTAGFFLAKLVDLGVWGSWAVLVAFYVSRVLQGVRRVWVTNPPWKIPGDNSGS